MRVLSFAQSLLFSVQYQASIEKSYKNKVAQEGYVAKARERYEQDCLRINAFTANSSIVQGKELDKLQKQMEKVQATVGNNEKEFRGLVKLLEQTTVNWESDWKGFCDVGCWTRPCSSSS